MRAVSGFLLLVVSVLLVAPLLVIPATAIIASTMNGDFSHNITELLSGTPLTPQGLFVLNLSLALIIPLTWALVAMLHGRSFASLISVRPGVRWKFLGACFGLAVIALVVQGLVSSLLPSDGANPPGHPQPFGWQTVAFILVIAFTTPLQAIGEEFAFRGYGLQLLGSLTKSPVIAVVATATLFALAHGVQNVPLFIDRFLFGVLAGFLVYRTGGLEAGIALHVMTNFVAFGSALAFFDITRIFTVHTASWWAPVETLVQSGVYIAMVLAAARRMGLKTTT